MSRVGVVRALSVAIGWALLALASSFTTLAADPTATPAPGGDPRSPGEGPGFVGEPLMAIGIVVGIALASVLLTLAYVRLTADPSRR